MRVIRPFYSHHNDDMNVFTFYVQEEKKTHWNRNDGIVSDVQPEQSWSFVSTFRQSRRLDKIFGYLIGRH